MSIYEARYWRVFEMVQADRPQSMDIEGRVRVGLIPSTSIINYLINVDRETSSSEIDRAIRMIHAIDIEFVALCNKGQSEDEESPRS